MLSSSWDTVFSIQSSPANGVLATSMTWHFSQRIPTLTDPVGAGRSFLGTATTCLATPRSTLSLPSPYVPGNNSMPNHCRKSIARGTTGRSL